MTIFLTVLHVLACLVLIVVVLLQRGKGAEVGAVFGGGGGATMFGSRGAGNFLTKLTTGAAVIFMLTSLTLAYFAQEGIESTLFEEGAAAEAEAPSPFGESQPPGEAEAPDGGFEEVAPPPEAEAPAPEAPAGDAAAPEPDVEPADGSTPEPVAPGP